MRLELCFFFNRISKGRSNITLKNKQCYTGRIENERDFFVEAGRGRPEGCQ